MSLNKLHAPLYNLDKTLLGGQSFSWECIDGVYYGVTSNKVLKLKQNVDYIYWQTYPIKDDEVFLRNYLRIDVNYPSILKNIDKDHHTSASIESFPGLRLLKQDFDDTLISFIISQNSNIPKIKRSIRILRDKLGKTVIVDGISFKLFPTIEKLAESTEIELRESGIGYRAKYLILSSQSVIKNKLSEKIHSLTYLEAKCELMKLHGVGSKVADCILVFSLSHDHITPMDVWGKRVLSDLYKLDPKMKYDDMLKWLNEYFGEYTAWAGQFLFEYIRSKKM